MNSLDKLEEQINNYINTSKFKENTIIYFENLDRKRQEEREKVSSKKYINWLYDYVSANKYADDECALYIYDGVDTENVQLLSAFLDYVEELAKQQKVLVIPDDEYEFGSECVFIKINDKYFELFRMYGQGAWTSINLLDKEPDYAFVKINV